MIAVNEIHNGDCVEIMKKIPDESIDLVLTSPPYDNLREYDGYSYDFSKSANEIIRVLKDGGICVWIVNDQTSNFKESLTSFKKLF